MTTLLLAAVAMGSILYLNRNKNSARETTFKDKHLPVEADISDHIARNTPFGFIRGRYPGKLEFKSPMPNITTNEFRQNLNEGSYGYAGPLTSPAINTAMYQRLIDEKFNIEEHPRLDPTRLDLTKGRHRRPQSVS